MQITYLRTCLLETGRLRGPMIAAVVVAMVAACSNSCSDKAGVYYTGCNEVHQQQHMTSARATYTGVLLSHWRSSVDPRVNRVSDRTLTCERALLQRLTRHHQYSRRSICPTVRVMLASCDRESIEIKSRLDVRHLLACVRLPALLTPLTQRQLCRAISR